MTNFPRMRRRLAQTRTIVSLASVITLAFVVAVVISAPSRHHWFIPSTPDESTGISMAAQPATGPMTSFVPQIPPRRDLPTPTSPPPSPTAEPEFISYLDSGDGVGANELGRIPVLMYHAFVHEEQNTDEWTLTFDQFREQLDWLVENDFTMVGIGSLITREFDVPAGRKPVVLTFDDASGGQFRMQASADGGIEPNPDTAVGILQEYRKKYPEFGGPALLAVVPTNCFDFPDDDPSTCEERLEWLIENDYEIGNHTMTHQDLTDVSIDVFKDQIFGTARWFNERIGGPNNLSDVLVLPFGAYPVRDDYRGLLFEGFWLDSEYFVPSLVVEVAGGPTRSPFHLEWTTRVKRYNTEPGVFWGWAESMEGGEVDLFVSDGDPNVVTVPEGWESALDQDLIAEDGRRIVIDNTTT